MAKNMFSFSDAQYAVKEANDAKNRLEIIESVSKDARISTLQEIGITFAFGFVSTLFNRVEIIESLLTIVGVAIIFAMWFYNNKHFYSKFGYGNALGSIANVAHWGWFLIPVFPLDIMVGGAILLYGAVVMLVCPAFYMKLIKHTETKRFNEAIAYLRVMGIDFGALNSQANVTYEGAAEEEKASVPLEKPVQIKYCTQCGAKVIAGNKFCTSCGSAL